jgi:hypothetical protein
MFNKILKNWTETIILIIHALSVRISNVHTTAYGRIGAIENSDLKFRCYLGFGWESGGRVHNIGLVVRTALVLSDQ